MSEFVPILAHVADTHLRTSQYGFSYRGEDFKQGLIHAIDEARNCGVSEIFHGGDMIDQRSPASDVIDQLVDVHVYLEDRNMWMYAVTGNHERAEPTWVGLLEKVARRFGGELRIKCIDHQRVTLRDGRTTVFGLPSMSAVEMRDYLINGKDTADFLLWHGAVKEFADFPTMDAVAISEFAACTRFQSVLLGDIHVTKYFALRDTGTIGYPGSTELCKGNEDPVKQIGIIYSDGCSHRVVTRPIPTRPVLLLRIMSEPDLDAAIIKLAATREQMPMVFASYNPTIPAVVSRMFAAMHHRSIFRAAAASITVAEAAPAPAQNEDKKRVEDFLPLYVAPSDVELYKLSQELIHAEAGAAALIQNFVDRLLNPSATTQSHAN